MTAFVEDRSVLTRAARGPDRTLRYGPNADHVIDVWLGQGTTPQRPLLVMIHGGFWRPEYDRHHTQPLCEAFASAGWTIAAIEYRRVPHKPDAMVDDVAAAMAALIRSELSNGRVIALGHSAGGHLCLHLAATCKYPEVIGAIALAPAADLQLVDRLNLDEGAVREFLGAAAIERADLDPTQLPSPAIPAVILHGQQDTIVPISVAQSYVERHSRARLVSIEHCGHFDLIDPQSAAWARLIAEVERFEPI